MRMVCVKDRRDESVVRWWEDDAALFIRQQAPHLHYTTKSVWRRYLKEKRKSARRDA